MAQQYSNLSSKSTSERSVNTDRRRVITGIGTLAATGWLPFSAMGQNKVSESEILIIGGGMAGAATAFHWPSMDEALPFWSGVKSHPKPPGKTWAVLAVQAGATCRTCSPI
jgi:hypothetical protein